MGWEVVEKEMNKTREMGAKIEAKIAVSEFQLSIKSNSKLVTEVGKEVNIL
jgi:hypothetical protein